MSFSCKKQKGFSLVEVMVSMFIFVIIMLAASQIFTQAFAGHRYTRNLQKDIENAQFIMGILSKELRTSTIVSPTGINNGVSSIKFYDHSQQKCLSYRITGGRLEVASQNVASSAICNGTSLTTYQTVSTGTITGSFDITSSQSTPRRVGKVTLGLRVQEGTHAASIQSTVSLRDYGADGSNL